MAEVIPEPKIFLAASIKNEPITAIKGEKKYVRLVLMHTFLNFAVPELVDLIKFGWSPVNIPKMKEARGLNDYLLARFGVIDQKISYSSEQIRLEVLKKINTEEANSLPTLIPFRHIEFVPIFADRLRDSAIKVADSIAVTNKNFHVVLVAAGIVNIKKLQEQAMTCLNKEKLAFECVESKDALNTLKNIDPLYEAANSVLSKVQKKT